MADWLTVEEVAERLRVSPRTVRGWLQEGRLKGRNLGGRAGWRIREEDVDAFMESQEGSGPEGKAAA